MRVWLLCVWLLAVCAACDVDDDGGGGGDSGLGGERDTSSTDVATDDGASPDFATGGDGGLRDAEDVESCVVFEFSQLVCFDAPNGELFRSIYSCDPGAFCDRPEARNENRDEIQCVDEYRYALEVYPATCGEVSDWFEERRECLVPTHCSDSDESGDWMCNGGSCVCPSGGDCPTVGPITTGPDAGVADAEDATTVSPGDAGMTAPDAATTGPDAATTSPDASPFVPDATTTTTPDSGEDEPEVGPAPPGG